MKSISRVLGIVGLVCLAFGLGVALYSGDFNQPYVIVNLGLGVMLALIAIIVNAPELKDGLTGRSTKAGANTFIFAVATITILVLINFVANRNNRQFDLTENKQFSLAEASVNLVKGLSKDVHVTGFFVGGQAGPVQGMLDIYRNFNQSKFSWEIVDPDRRPELAERYGVRANATLVVESGDERKTLTNLNLASLEESLSNAILGVTSAGKKTICAVEGHGERSFDDQQSEQGFATAKKALEGENYQLEPLLLASVGQVPESCSIVMIAGPERAFLTGEISALQKYLERGGRLMVMLDPGPPGPLVSLLKQWGVEVRHDLVVDTVRRLYEGESLGLQPIVTSYAPEHPITRGFTKQTIFTQARSVAAATPPTGYQVVELAKASRSSWGETRIQDLIQKGVVERDDEDYPGPVALAAAVGPAEGESGGKAKIVVFGDVDFAGNRFISAFFNNDFFLNAVNWLSDQEKQISIRPKGPRASFVRLTDSQMATVFYMAVLIFPQLLLTLGILIGWRRR